MDRREDEQREERIERTEDTENREDLALVLFQMEAQNDPVMSSSTHAAPCTRHRVHGTAQVPCTRYRVLHEYCVHGTARVP